MKTVHQHHFCSFFFLSGFGFFTFRFFFFFRFQEQEEQEEEEKRKRKNRRRKYAIPQHTSDMLNYTTLHYNIHQNQVMVCHGENE